MKFSPFDRVEVGLIRPDGKSLLTRWRIVSTPRFGVKVHRINHPDNLADGLHNHPWPFVSFRLGRRYTEVVAERGRDGHGSPRVRRAWVSLIRTRQMHAVTEVPQGGVWTLVINGRRSSREWGFQRSTGAFVEASEVFGATAHNEGTKRAVRS